jgi:hypothetical protein
MVKFLHLGTLRVIGAKPRAELRRTRIDLLSSAEKSPNSLAIALPSDRRRNWVPGVLPLLPLRLRLESNHSRPSAFPAGFALHAQRGPTRLVLDRATLVAGTSRLALIVIFSEAPPDGISCALVSVEHA